MRKPWKNTEKKNRRHTRARYKGSLLSRIGLHVDHHFEKSLRSYNKQELWRIINGFKDDGIFKYGHLRNEIYHYW